MCTLGCSRRFHFWVTDCADAEGTYEAQVRAFERFGGVQAEVLVDRQKATVIAHRREGTSNSIRDSSIWPCTLGPASLSACTAKAMIAGSHSKMSAAGELPSTTGGGTYDAQRGLGCIE